MSVLDGIKPAQAVGDAITNSSSRPSVVGCHLGKALQADPKKLKIQGVPLRFRCSLGKTRIPG
jgi:hypothetical protein